MLDALSCNEPNPVRWPGLENSSQGKQDTEQKQTLDKTQHTKDKTTRQNNKQKNKTLNYTLWLEMKNLRQTNSDSSEQKEQKNDPKGTFQELVSGI